MSEEPKPVFRELKGKDYVFNSEKLACAPFFHSNHVAINVTNEEAVLMFGIRVDSINAEDDSVDVIPQMVCFMSLTQADSMAKALTSVVDQLKIEIQRRVAEAQKTNA